VPGLPTALTACLVAALAGAGAAELFPRGLAPVDAGLPPAARASLGARSCGGCHAEAHADWAKSRHGRAWTNAIFQREYKDRPLAWCVHCHAPLREQLEEVHRGGGPLADEGVTCAACHLRGGRMLARRHAAASPHDTEVRADFGGPAFCAGCHQFNFPVIATDGAVTGYTEHPMQDTVHQHDAGRFATRPCLDCHRAGEGGHLFPGGHDPGMLARAVALEACRAGGALEVRLTNAGAGHNVPTGDVHRHLVLRAWRADAPEHLQERLFGRRFEPAPDGGKLTVADTTIASGDARAVDIDVSALGGTAAAISLELRLVYTIDELPFRGRELAEPTWQTMITRDIRWSGLPRCARPSTAAPPGGKLASRP
jgi:hypothetical protein